MRNNYPDVAKAYILYREKHKLARERRTIQSVHEHKLNLFDDHNNKTLFDQDVYMSTLTRISKRIR